MKPYIYKITNKDTKEFYIGSQCSGKIIGKNYFTSSSNNEFRQDFKLNVHKYLIEILKEFDNSLECIKEENILIKENFNNPLIINKAYNCGEHLFTTVKYSSNEERTRANKESDKRYYISHKKEIKKYQKKWLEKNKEHYKKILKRWEKDHIEERKENHHKNYEKNKEKILKRQKERREEKKEELKEYYKQYNILNKERKNIARNILKRIKKIPEIYEQYNGLPVGEKEHFRNKFYEDHKEMFIS